MTKWLTQEQQRVWRLWLEVTQRQTVAVEEDLQECSGLSSPDYEILVRLSESPSLDVRMSELADSVIVSRSRLTYRIDRLEKLGLVTREGADGDRRGVVARLTPAGMKHLEQAAPRHVERVQELMFEQLDADDLVALHRILSKLAGPARGES